MQRHAAQAGFGFEQNNGALFAGVVGQVNLPALEKCAVDGAGVLIQDGITTQHSAPERVGPFLVEEPGQGQRPPVHAGLRFVFDEAVGGYSPEEGQAFAGKGDPLTAEGIGDGAAFNEIDFEIVVAM